MTQYALKTWVSGLIGAVSLLGAMGAGVPAAAQDTVRNDRLSVEITGQGRDVILVPGYASSREVWRPTAERLSPHYRVHLVQLAGFAGEPWIHGDGAFLEPAMQAIADYAETLDRPAYIGHSMGGVIGLKLAQDAPQRFSRVMSVDSLPFYGSLMGPDATVDTVRPAATQMRAAILAATPAAFEAQQTATASAMTLTETYWPQIVGASLTSDRQALATAISELVVTDVRAGLASMTTPVWAVYAVDTTTPVGAMARTVWTREYQSLPNVRLEGIEGSRHFIMVDQPERLYALIDDFLKP